MGLEGTFTWPLSEDILEEYKRVLERHGVRQATVGSVVNLIREQAEEIRPHTSDPISPDPRDDAFCICAEAGEVDFIVTLNPKDFPQKRLRAKVQTIPS